MTDAFEVYVQYTAIKLTYDTKSDYDYFHYGGRLKRKKSTFMKRPDRSKYYHIAKTFGMDLEQVVDFLFLSLFYNPNDYISATLSAQNIELWERFKHYRDDYTSALKQEVIELSEHMGSEEMSTVDLLSTKNGPSKLMEYTYGRVYTPMLLHSINRCVNVVEPWLKSETSFMPMLNEPLRRFVTLDQRLRKHSDHLTKNDLNGIVGSTILQRGR